MEPQHYRGYHRSSRIDYADGANTFFVTVCVAPRRSVFVSPDRNEALIAGIRQLQDEGLWGAYLFCVMPDHLHVVANPGPRGLSEAVRVLKGRFATWWRAHGDGQGLWQKGFFDHRLRSDESFADKCAYVAMNPVRAGLAKCPEEYPWTGSFTTYFGRR